MCIHTKITYIENILRFLYIFRLIHLFEGGILEKMTNTEYEMMINLSKNRMEHDVVKTNDGQKTTQHITYFI